MLCIRAPIRRFLKVLLIFIPRALVCFCAFFLQPSPQEEVFDCLCVRGVNLIVICFRWIIVERGKSSCVCSSIILPRGDWSEVQVGLS